MEIKKKCKIIVKGGNHYLTMPNGDIIPGQVWSRVTDVVNQKSYAIIKVHIELVETKL